MKILHLTLNKKWFDMILSGEKKEEYRELKKYWSDRLLDKIMCDVHSGFLFNISDDFVAKKFDVIEFSNGYSPKSRKMTIEFEGLEIRGGNSYWGADDFSAYFVLKLGKILETKNL